MFCLRSLKYPAFKLGLCVIHKGKDGWYVPSVIALMRIVEARIKMIMDALPSSFINFLTTCWPAKAANVATSTKYVAETPNYTIIRNSNKKKTIYLTFFDLKVTPRCALRSTPSVSISLSKEGQNFTVRYWKTFKDVVLHYWHWWWKYHWKCWSCTCYLQIILITNIIIFKISPHKSYDRGLTTINS